MAYRLIGSAFIIICLIVLLSCTDTSSITGTQTTLLPEHTGFIYPNLGASAPIKGERRESSVPGVFITRITDASELSGTVDALIVYSRYSPENTDGNLILVFGSNSNSSWVVNRVTGLVVNELTYLGKGIGENHEVRWDISKAHPNRVYFRSAMSFYYIDDVFNPVVTLIKDFSNISTKSTKIYNDVEGDSSNDSNIWAWMAVHYDGITFIVDKFIVYNITTNTTNTLSPEAMTNTNLNHYNISFPRPNMVEISPLGTGVVLHYGRAWGSATYGNRYLDIGTWFDGPHIWPLDFDFISSKPNKISIGETHSGWSFDNLGNEYFISQNNRTDKLDASNVLGGFIGRIQVADHSNFGWSNGFHYGKMPSNKPNWIFINTYSNINDLGRGLDWGADQFIMIEMKNQAANPRILRIGSNYNEYSGFYRDEAPAAINTEGTRIYVSTNWGGRLPNREVFMFELPLNWDK